MALAHFVGRDVKRVNQHFNPNPKYVPIKQEKKEKKESKKKEEIKNEKETPKETRPPSDKRGTQRRGK